MKNAIQTITYHVPPYALFLLGLCASLAFGMVKLLAALREAGMGQ